jgi:NAD(P)-dependent dehydrogenase (short-subunit alcohol dehydrogenase family)
MIDLKGKRALVTGGSRGIGAAIAQVLAEYGADVAITYQNSPERADSVVFSIETLGRRGLAVQADSADPDAIKRAVHETVETLGGLDILVNNAGVGLAGEVADLDLMQFQKMMDVNVR